MHSCETLLVIVITVIELQGYKDDFNVENNYSFINRIVKSVLIAIFYFGLIIIVKPPIEISIVLLIAFLIVGSYIGDKYLRTIYSDWPISSKFDKKVNLSTSKIRINDKEIEVENIQELLLFWDFYKRYSVGITPERNGNALLFCKHDNKIDIIKLNIDSEHKFKLISELILTYKRKTPYFKTYHTNEIKHILTPNYSDRIRYQ